MSLKTVLATSDWDFSGETTDYATHGLHKYPGRMPPQIPRRFIKTFHDVSHVFDPFCGSGTTLVEAVLAGKKATGVDINPLAILISKVKTTPISPDKLELAKNEVLYRTKERVEEVRMGKKRFFLPFDPKEVNLSYWFSRKAIDELSAISTYLLKDFPVEKYGLDVLRFFQLCFSDAVRKVSYQKSDEFKLYRMKNWKEHNVDMYRTFEETVVRANTRMKEFYQILDKEIYVKVIEGDFSKLEITIEPVDIIITSPPYGDSRTTLAYGQFSRYPLLWLGYTKDEAYNVDSLSMGGNKEVPDDLLPSKAFSKILLEIKKKDSKRAEIVKSYFFDLFACMKKIYHILEVDGHACFVIGNRTVQGINVPTHLILIEFGEQVGFEHLTTIQRRISSKILPRRNRNVKTINEERIVVLHKG